MKSTFAVLLTAATLVAADDVRADEATDPSLHLGLGAKLDLLRNVAGGMSVGGQPMLHVEFNANADFEKMLGWSGGSGLFSLVYDGGGTINAERVGSQMGVSNIEVPTSTYRLFQAWLQQEFAGGRGAVLIGLYPIDSEFQVLDSAAIFLQPPYGATADMAQTRGPSIFDNSALGVRARWLSEDRAAYLQGAVLDGVPGDPDHPQGTHIHFNKGDGAFGIAETGLKPAPTGTSPAIEKYALGAWRYTSRADDLMDQEADQSPAKRLSWGWYALAEKTLWHSHGDWAGFVRVSATDGDSTAVRRAMNIGVSGRGIVAGQDADQVGIGYSRAVLSDKYRVAQQLGGTDMSAYEDAWELSYRHAIDAHLTVQPDIQRIAHPGGSRTSAAAVIVGARLEASY